MDKIILEDKKLEKFIIEKGNGIRGRCNPRIPHLKEHYIRQVIMI